MGGRTDDRWVDDIYILDTKRMIIHKSNIKIPIKYNCNAVLINGYSNKKYKLLVIGFIKICWNGKEFKNIVYPSNDIINIIINFYCNEGYIHLSIYDQDKKITKQYKMEIDDIFQQNKNKPIHVFP